MLQAEGLALEGQPPCSYPVDTGGSEGGGKLALLLRWAAGAVPLVSVVTTQSAKAEKKLYYMSKEEGPSCDLKLKVKVVLCRLRNGGVDADGGDGSWPHRSDHT